MLQCFVWPEDAGAHCQRCQTEASYSSQHANAWTSVFTASADSTRVTDQSCRHQGLVLCQLLLPMMTGQWCQGRWFSWVTVVNWAKWVVSWLGWGAANWHSAIPWRQQHTEWVDQPLIGCRWPECWGTADSHQRSGAMWCHEMQWQCSGQPCTRWTTVDPTPETNPCSTP